MSEAPAYTRTSMKEAGGEQARPVWLADLVGDLMADALKALAAAAAGKARGPVTKLERLDAALGHALEPGLHVITGDPGAGKTALALHAASHCGTPAVFVTGEQAPKILLRRLAASATRTTMDELRGMVPERLKELLERTVEAAPQLLILDALRGPASGEQIIQLAAAARKRFDSGSVLVVVDSLQCWARGAYVGAEYDCAQAGLAELARVASVLDAPVVVLSHRNRQSSRDKDGDFAMTAAKGSADFEHLAETVLHLVRRTDKGEVKPPDEREITVHVAKNRNGESGFSLPLYFTQSTQTFSDRAGGLRW